MSPPPPPAPPPIPPAPQPPATSDFGSKMPPQTGIQTVRIDSLCHGGCESAMRGGVGGRQMQGCRSRFVNCKSSGAWVRDEMGGIRSTQSINQLSHTRLTNTRPLSGGVSGRWDGEYLATLRLWGPDCGLLAIFTSLAMRCVTSPCLVPTPGARSTATGPQLSGKPPVRLPHRRFDIGVRNTECGIRQGSRHKNPTLASVAHGGGVAATGHTPTPSRFRATFRVGGGGGGAGSGGGVRGPARGGGGGFGPLHIRLEMAFSLR